MPPRRRWVARLLLESVLIVSSILLAFALNRWWEARQERTLAENALASFEREIRQNRQNLERVAPYHLRLREQFSELNAAGSVRSFEDLRRIEGFEGFRPAFLTTTAWQTALATGALMHLEYGVVAEISAVYTVQDRFTQVSDFSFLFAPGAFSEGTVTSTVISAEIYLTDVTYGAHELMQVYDQALERLNRRRRQ